MALLPSKLDCKALPGNGNILSQTRYAQTTLIDDLSYKYTRDVNQKLLRNQLNYVTDAVVGSTPTDDIESQSLGNYKYDELGNLRKDSIEQIETIEWNVYGKIKKIKRYLASTKSNLEFMYDASGTICFCKAILAPINISNYLGDMKYLPVLSYN